MQSYEDKNSLKQEIEKRAKLFIDEFDQVEEKDKDKLVDEVDKTPAQMISYNIGWMRLILSWEIKNKKGIEVKTPHEDYKWNNLGGLYKSFYKDCEDMSIKELQAEFKLNVRQILELIDSYTDEEIFGQGQRQWASSTKSAWPIYKWIHINTVAPFKTFRTKIRKWKKISNSKNV